MATVLMVHANLRVSGVQYTGLSSLAAHVRRAGHRYRLFDCAGYRPAPDGEPSRSMADNPVPLLFRPLEKGGRLPDKRDAAQLYDDLVASIQQARPDVIGFSCFSDDWPFALWLIRRVKTAFAEIPIVVGGIHATLVPERVLAHPEVAAVCIGEGEEALVDLLDALPAGRLDPTVRGFWFREGGGIRKNPLRRLPRFDADTPFLDWSDYGDLHFIYPYEGKLYRRGSVSLARGCPHACSFCVNGLLKNRVGPERGRVRRKDVDYAVAELVHLKERHRLEFLRFWDETFLAMPLAYLTEFGRRYREQVGLPFTIETTADSITRQKARLLAEMGCRSVSVGVETADDRKRRTLLNKPVTNAQYARAFALLDDCGIRKVANFMFLLPHQTVDEMHDCIRLCAEWKIESPSPRIFYPYPGTALRETCFQEGLIDTGHLARIENEDRIRGLEDLSGEYATFADTVLRIPADVQVRARRLMDNFVLLQDLPEGQHRWVLGLLERDDREAATKLEGLRGAVSEKRFGAGGGTP